MLSAACSFMEPSKVCWAAFLVCPVFLTIEVCVIAENEWGGEVVAERRVLD